MNKKQTIEETTKPNLHPRNKHRQRYDLAKLTQKNPALKPFVFTNKYGKETIDFFNPEAVKRLNQSLLLEYYGLTYWDIPDGYLCPPIPGRADYIHYAADLLAETYGGTLPLGAKINCLDIGVGANAIYPIIGQHEYGWQFRGVDIDPLALQNVHELIAKNPSLQNKIALRLQTNANDYFFGVIGKKEYFDITICNPPFHASAAEALENTQRKIKNLTGKKTTVVTSNFAGQSKELWCEGGERRFIRNMIKESKKFAANCLWFSTLVAKEATLKPIYQTLKKVVATEVKTIEMGQGQKRSRVVAWTFLGQKRRDQWVAKRWK
ncbi:MAG: 23S rRNA (adenine(1618)-N(6))-methyltransferase RlmF [Bacteroidota bacterium]